MAFWDGTPPHCEWRWQKRRVWWPAVKCNRSGKSLFLRKAYLGVYLVDWEYTKHEWLSEQEYLWKTLKEG